MPSVGSGIQFAPALLLGAPADADEVEQEIANNLWPGLSVNWRRGWRSCLRQTLCACYYQICGNSCDGDGGGIFAKVSASYPEGHEAGAAELEQRLVKLNEPNLVSDADQTKDVCEFVVARAKEIVETPEIRDIGETPERARTPRGARHSRRSARPQTNLGHRPLIFLGKSAGFTRISLVPVITYSVVAHTPFVENGSSLEDSCLREQECSLVLVVLHVGCTFRDEIVHVLRWRADLTPSTNEGETERQKDRKAERQKDRGTERKNERKKHRTERQTDRKNKRQKERKKKERTRDRHTEHTKERNNKDRHKFRHKERQKERRKERRKEMKKGRKT